MLFLYLFSALSFGNKKISIKDSKLRLNLKYFWENWFQNCFFNKTGSKTEPIPINQFKNGTGFCETGLPALL